MDTQLCSDAKSVQDMPEKRSAADVVHAPRSNVKLAKLGVAPAEVHSGNTSTLLLEHEAGLQVASELLEDPVDAACVAVSLRRASEAEHPWVSRLPLTRHAGDAVQPTLLQSTRHPPLTYMPAIPRRIVKTGVLSEVQLEAVLFAGQTHSLPLSPAGYRSGFLLADGAGVGKGRTQAAIVLDAWLQGHQKALWVSASADLLADARRDLEALANAAPGTPPLHTMLIPLTQVLATLREIVQPLPQRPYPTAERAPCRSRACRCLSPRRLRRRAASSSARTHCSRGPRAWRRRVVPPRHPPSTPSPPILPWRPPLLILPWPLPPHPPVGLRAGAGVV